MIWPQTGELFNPLTAPTSAPVQWWEALAGPYGLVAFVLLVPLVRMAARRSPAAALSTGGAAWLLATTGPIAAAVLLIGVALGVGWLRLLAALRRHQRISAAGMRGAVWLGLHLLILPVWWTTRTDWYGWMPSRFHIMHQIGFAYFLLRFIAWGVRTADAPDAQPRWKETICWLLYPPCMRLGPVLLREDFLLRYDAWDPGARVDWRTVRRRFGLFLLGLLGMAALAPHAPHLAQDQADFFGAPHEYPTDGLISWFYLIPIQIYLLLWTYNELAAALAAWVGIRIDDNFRWLPAATSMRDFWRRWHITVGAWLRDFIYVPLGGSRRRTTLNLILVFGYVGVWHGPSWSFLAWGLLQAAAIIVERGWERVRPRVLASRAPIGRLWTVVAWLLTMHYAAATIVIFADFEYCGTRFLAELARRIIG